ncbi:MAG TPA: hypothetical protein VIM14_19625 [Polyangia bacterium]|jgi:hypothetical protein
MKNRATTSLLQIIALSTSLLAARTGAAQVSSTNKPDHDGWVPVKHLEFSPDDIEGGTSGPEGEPILSVPRAQHDSLIEIRSGFESEIVKTMETM